MCCPEGDCQGQQVRTSLEKQAIESSTVESARGGIPSILAPGLIKRNERRPFPAIDFTPFGRLGTYPHGSYACVGHVP